MISQYFVQGRIGLRLCTHVHIPSEQAVKTRNMSSMSLGEEKKVNHFRWRNSVDLYIAYSPIQDELFRIIMFLKTIFQIKKLEPE